MPTVINNPPPTNNSGDSGTGVGLGLMFGIIIAALIIVGALVIYGIPLIRSFVPKGGATDINVHLPDQNSGGQNPGTTPTY